MTHYDRRVCQDYTKERKALDAKALERKQEIVENIKAAGLLLVLFLLFCVAGSLTYPY